MNAPASHSHHRFHLLDLSALVVGYGLASLLVRAFWAPAGMRDTNELFVLGMAFLWLGLAMSGPIVMLIHRGDAPEPEDADRTEPRTWAELAWLIIGFYWIGLTILVVPVRLPESRLLDSAVLGIFPILAALGLRTFGRGYLAQRRSPPGWTHQVAVGLLVTWPFAWVALILLEKTW